MIWRGYRRPPPRAMDTAVAKHSGPHMICVIFSLVSNGAHIAVLWFGSITYCCDRLHTNHEGVRGQIPRVRQGVLLPKLGEEIARASESGVIQDEVSFSGRAFCQRILIIVVHQSSAHTYLQRSSGENRLPPHISTGFSLEGKKLEQRPTEDEPSESELVTPSQLGVEACREP